eukprot:196506_1
MDLNGWDSSNHINGTYVSNDLNLTCGTNAVCYRSNVICPNDANCNIDCSQSILGCEGMIVAALEGTHDVNWKCNDDSSMSCVDALLACVNLSDPAYIWSSRWYSFPYSSSYLYTDGVWALENNTDGCVDIPTVAPTFAPTNPTTSPTSPTAAPLTEIPTHAPTEDAWLTEKEFTLITTGSLLLFVLIVGGLIYYFKCRLPERKTLYIKKGLVIVIGIGEYDDVIYDPQENEIDGYLRNLYGIDKDIEHLVSLFHDELNFDVYPSQYLKVLSKDHSPKISWKERELKDVLEERAQYLEDNIDRYDGLIVVMSCHGMGGYICTSDYKKFSKVAIHRIFSATHPASRDIPRLFIFDCCSGNSKQETERESDEKDREEVGKSTLYPDVPKQIALCDVDGDGQSWIVGEHNPDFRLAVVEAANPGFQSKLRTDIGSYVIHSFCKKTLDNLRNNRRMFIHQIFDEIQHELHKAGKQHPTYIWSDNTRYIRFKKSDKDQSKPATEIEMSERQMNIYLERDRND